MKPFAIAQQPVCAFISTASSSLEGNTGVCCLMFLPPRRFLFTMSLGTPLDGTVCGTVHFWLPLRHQALESSDKWLEEVL